MVVGRGNGRRREEGLAMSGKTVGSTGVARGTRWGAVAFGWMVAVVTGIAVSTIAMHLYAFATGPPPDAGEPTVTLVVVSVFSGFLSYLVGGYAAARAAGHSGGKHGALAAVSGLFVGIILTIVLALFGTVFVEGISVPPAGFGFFGTASIAGSILFLVNLFGGFVGGKLGEPSNPDVGRLG